MSEADKFGSLLNYVSSLGSINPTWKLFNFDTNKSDHFTNLVSEEYKSQHNELIQRSADIDNQFYSSIESASVELYARSGLGRHLLATRDFYPGEVVFFEEPLLLVPKAGNGPTCLSCFCSLPEDEWPTCSGCGSPICRPKCTGFHHSTEECSILARYKLKDTPKKMEMIKLLNVILTPLRSWMYSSKSKEFSYIMQSLQSNSNTRKKFPIGKFIEKRIVPLLKEKLNIDISSDEIHEIMGVFDTNAFEVSVGNNHHARAILPLASMMNHSCTPNTQHWYYHGLLVVTAATFIPKGSEVTNSYSQTFWGTRTRRNHLRLTKLFKCNCPRCQDPTEFGTYLSSIVCKNCEPMNKGFIMPPVSPGLDWKCNQCSSIIPCKVMDLLIDAAVTFTQAKYVYDRDTIQTNINNLKVKLGEQHYIIIELQYFYVNNVCSLNDDVLDKACIEQANNYSENLLLLTDKLEPGHYRLKGLLLLSNLKVALMILKHNSLNPTCIENCDSRQQQSGHPAPLVNNFKELSQRFLECSKILAWDEKLEELITVADQFLKLIDLRIKDNTTSEFNDFIIILKQLQERNRLDIQKQILKIVPINPYIQIKQTIKNNLY